MKLGSARYARRCPLCAELIQAGGRIACKWVDGRYIWVHELCASSWQFERADRRLNAEFRSVVSAL